MPNGEVQPEFKERLAYIGNWLNTYGESIYNTKGGYIRPQHWGCITQKGDTMFVHILNDSSTTIQLENFPYKKLTKAYLLKNNSAIKTSLKNGLLTVEAMKQEADEPDEVIVLVCRN